MILCVCMFIWEELVFLLLLFTVMIHIMQNMHKWPLYISHTYCASWYYQSFFIHQLMHKWIFLKTILITIIAQDDGADIEFRNVGFYTSDAGEIPKRTQTTFWTRQKSKNYQDKLPILLFSTIMHTEFNVLYITVFFTTAYFN